MQATGNLRKNKRGIPLGISYMQCKKLQETNSTRHKPYTIMNNRSMMLALCNVKTPKVANRKLESK